MQYPCYRCGAILGAALCVLNTSGALFWNETSDGDLSNNQSTPNSFVLENGANSVVGTVNALTDFQDWLAVTISSGFQLSAVRLAAYISTDPIAFTGFQSGSSFVGSSFVESSYLGYTHIGPGNVGSDLLPLMENAFGAQGFTAPLQAGTYTFVIQQAGSSLTSYQFDYEVTPVPEPRTQAAIALLCAAFFLSRKFLQTRSGRAGTIIQ